MKKILFFLACTLFSIQAWTQCGTLSFGSSSVSGNTFTIPVNLNGVNASNINFFNFQINFTNSSKVTPQTTAMNNSIHSALPAAAAVTTTTSSIVLNGNASFNLSGSFKLFDIVITVKPGESTTLSFATTAGFLYNGYSNQCTYPSTSTTITGPSVTISGNTDNYGGGYNLSNTAVEVYNSTKGEILNPNVTTNSSGNYNSGAQYPGDSYKITPSRTGNIGCGVTTADITDIQRHILNIQPFVSPWKNIAADVNNSGTITAYDNTLIQAHILGNGTLPNSWYFATTSSYILIPPNQSQVPAYDKFMTLNNVNTNQTSKNFHGFKVGDVNGSCPQSSAFQETEPLATSRNGGNQNIRIIKVPTESGKVRLAVYASQFKNQLAFAFGLKLNNEVFNDIRIVPAALPAFDEGDYTLEEENGDAHLSIVWFIMEAEGVSLKANQALFYIDATVQDEVQNLKRLIALSNKRVENKIYNTAGNSENIELDIFEENNRITEGPTIIKQSKAFPTIIKNEATLSFILEKAATVQLLITDSNGQIIRNRRFQLTEGEQFIQLNDLGNLHPGTYHYQLIANGKKMGGTLIKADR